MPERTFLVLSKTNIENEIFINNNIITAMLVGIIMVDRARVNGILGELSNNPSISSSLVVSRSGMHLAGQAPPGVHLETFVAMSAILLGSAETAISELKGELENVLVELDRSRIIIESAGSKAILVVVTKSKEDLTVLNSQVKKAADDLSTSL
jgi:predicted regulator of Ras-like GTPase activity (Roadblock/LC7/MglB family)